MIAWNDFSTQITDSFSRPNKKNRCVSGKQVKKILVGRHNFFSIIFVADRNAFQNALNYKFFQKKICVPTLATLNPETHLVYLAKIKIL